MLREVAYQMQTSTKGLAGNLIEAADLEKILSDYLVNNNLYSQQAREVARLMMKQLRARNFMLCFVGADYYAFVHRTFLEYFCAVKFVMMFEKEQSLSKEQLKEDVFGQHWHDETWHEVLRLIAGLIDPKFTGEIIDYLIAQEGEEEDFRNIFLAAKCLQEVRNRAVIDESVERLLYQLKGLIRYGFNLNHFLDFSDDEYNQEISQIREQAIDAIANTFPDRPDILTWLKLCATLDEDRNVQSNITNTLNLIKEYAIQDKDDYIRFSAIAGLADNFQNDPDTLNIIQNATNDEDGKVRYSAVAGLAKNFQNDPNTLNILQNATNDEYFLVKYKALVGLASNFKDNADILKILKESATQDKDERLRSSTIQLLARYFKDEPEMREFFIDCAKNDSFITSFDIKNWDDNPRKVALSATLQLYPNHPQNLTLLRELAENDPDEKLREFAQKAIYRIENVTPMRS